MALTGQLGTITSQPGQVQPGYAFTGLAVWRGPFPGTAVLSSGAIGVARGQVIQVSLADEARLAAADPNWWELH